MDKCLFAIVRDCPNPDAPLAPITENRKISIKNASQRRKDELHTKIDDEKNYVCHSSCVKSYTSEQHIVKSLKRHAKTHAESPIPKKTRRSLSSFNFKLHCLFCGEICNLNPDKKNPSRWRRAFKVRTLDPKYPYKQLILDTCSRRGDNQAEEVAIRVNGARADLHSAEARYHDDCRLSFMGDRNVLSVARLNSIENDEEKDVPFEKTCKAMSNCPDKIWSSVELYAAYQNEGGEKVSRRELVSKVKEFFGEKVLVFSSPGIANVILFTAHATTVLSVVKDEEEDIDMSKLAKTIRKEIDDIPKQKNVYRKRIDYETANMDVSPSVNALLSAITPKFNNSLAGVVIGNIITSVVSSRATNLQISLALLANKSKLIQHFFDYGICCTPDEIRRFKISAAVDTSKKQSNQISTSKGGLVQVVIDNYDTPISSQNGLEQTHSLATIITQPEKPGSGEEVDISKPETIPRLKKSDLKYVELPDIPMKQYDGPKKPAMPEHTSKYNVPSLAFLAQQAVIVNISQEKDFQFLSNICKENEPEYAGFNTRLLRQSGVQVKPKNRTMYRPLIDKNPSDPSTVLTTLLDSKRIVNDAGQDEVVVTADQQIYRVMVDLSWACGSQLDNFVLRLGGMHMFMSFVGCVGVLMANSGLEELMKAAFAGVPKMLSGKNFPMNVRALRMVVEELLRNTIPTFTLYDDMVAELDILASQSRTAKHWVENLIKPVLIMMMYVRAEREGEWALHLYAVKQMLPYFFAAGHVNYARYASYYIRSMQKLPKAVQEKFMAGEHVMRHQKGVFNGIWSDMHIETTFMRHGKGPRGLVGITLKPKAVKQWSLSLHACSQILQDLEEMRNRNNCKDQLKHKEELPGRIRSDSQDRNKIREKLATMIHPLEVQEGKQMVNIYTGAVSPPNVNVERAVEIGKIQRERFDLSLPRGFYDTIKKEVITMTIAKKSIKVGDVEVFDTDLIFARVMCLLNAGHLKLEDVFSYELSPIPVSLFKENGEMRINHNKSDLKNILKVDVSARTQPRADTVIIDGCAMLYAVYWPPAGTVADLIQSVMGYINQYKEAPTIYLIFDRYFEFSPKGGTRQSRAAKFMNNHELFLTAPLPAQKNVLGSYTTKQNLIILIVEQLRMHYEEQNETKMIITGPTASTQSCSGSSVERDDLTNTHEEADSIIIHQLKVAIDEGAQCVKIICDDTDVFILLMHYYHLFKWNCDVLMVGTSGERRVISIQEAINQHEGDVDSLLALHALSGCDTVPQMSGIGKKKALNALRKGNILSNLGNIDSPLQSVVNEACQFIAACYGVEKCASIAAARYALWNKKLTNKTAPLLKSLPATLEVLTENIKRAHYQTAIWKHSHLQSPPTLNPIDYGWFKESNSSCLLPVMIPTGVRAAPAEVLKLIRCTCSSDSPCGPTSRCSCSKAQMSCSEFCSCYNDDSTTCCNKWTVFGNDDDDECE